MGKRGTTGEEEPNILQILQMLLFLRRNAYFTEEAEGAGEGRKEIARRDDISFSFLLALPLDNGKPARVVVRERRRNRVI